MLSRRFACLLLGMWLGGILLMLWIDTGRTASVDRVLVDTNPAVAARLKLLPPADARMLLMHQALEQNRWIMSIWEPIQLAFGMLFFGFLLFGTREGKFVLALSLLMLAVVLFERLILSSELVVTGRMSDFISPDLHSGDRNRFWVLHNIYRIAEIVKLGLGAMLAVVLASTAPRRLQHPWQQVNFIDKTDDSHIDR